MKNPALVGAAVALPCLFATGVRAQAQPGEFLVTAYANSNLKTKGGLFVVGGLGGTVVDLKATGDLANSYSVARDPYDDTAFWVGTRSPTNTGSPSIYKVTAVAGKILATAKLNLALTSADSIVHQLHVWGHRMLFLTATQLSSVPLTGGKPTVLATFNSTTGSATNFATDGRRLYLHMQPVANLLAEHVYALDLETPKVRKLIYQSPGITYFIPSLTMDAAGGLLMTESEAFSGVSNLKQLDTSGKTLQTFKLPFTHGVAGAHTDPGGNLIVVAGRTYDTVNSRTVTSFVTLLNWKIFKTLFGTSPEFFTRVDVRGHRSLDRFGHVCPSNNGNWRSEIAATGLPSLGNSSYKLWVKGIPAAPAMLLVGVHGGMPVPFPLSVMGAGTCELGVQPLASVAVTLTNNGDLTLPAAIPSTINPVNIDVQWLIRDSAANSAGFVSSQVGSIVIR